MKAAIYTRYGPPEVVSIQEVKNPVPRSNEVLIKIHAATVNRTDCGFRSAQYFVSRFFSGLFAPRNKILGCEFAGEVVEVGESVTTFKVGDGVFGYDDTGFGGHAEYKTMAETGAIATIPIGMGYSEAAPLTEGSHYALGNIRAAKIKTGDTVLVYGATGAIGSAAVQLLKHFGAFVVAVANSQHVDLIKSLGADEVIDYQTEDFTQTSRRFDFVFDAVGKSSFGQCKPLMKAQGKYISTELGRHSENVFLAIIGKFRTGKRVLFPIPFINQEDVLFLKELAEAGQFKPVIDRQYPLARIVEAHRFVDTGQKTGNVVINIG